jgi:hypothetical protein
VFVNTETTTVTVKDPPDVLDRQKCLDALAALRHAKWFQVRYYFYTTLQPYDMCFLLYFTHFLHEFV